MDEKKKHKCCKTVLAAVKRIWYILLLCISTGYLYNKKFAIIKLNDASLTSTVFIIWVILMLLPLFSELEFLGVKFKREVKEAVEKSNEEVKHSIRILQQIVSQNQLSNSVANQFTINNVPLPNEEQMKGLIEQTHNLEKQNGNKLDDGNSIMAVPKDNMEMFKIRFGIEMAIKEAFELIEYDGKNHITTIQMAKYLCAREFLDPQVYDLLVQVIRIANRGVHGEIISREYTDLALRAYPQIIEKLDECKDNVKATTYNRRQMRSYSHNKKASFSDDNTFSC